MSVGPPLKKILARRLGPTYEQDDGNLRERRCVILRQRRMPTHFFVDFELAAVKAISTVFGDSSVVKGCTFHFRQAVFRGVQTEGLQSKYEDTENRAVWAWIRQLMSMTMLPVFAMPLVWNSLKTPYRRPKTA